MAKGFKIDIYIYIYHEMDIKENEEGPENVKYEKLKCEK
jgi:hypothetical protein